MDSESSFRLLKQTNTENPVLSKIYFLYFQVILKQTNTEDPVLSKIYFLYFQVISNLYKLYQNMDKEFLDAVLKALDVFEREIVSRSKPFFGGIGHRICI